MIELLEHIRKMNENTKEGTIKVFILAIFLFAGFWAGYYKAESVYKSEIDKAFFAGQMREDYINDNINNKNLDEPPLDYQEYLDWYSNLGRCKKHADSR